MPAHPHAASMLQYAQDAAETDMPWERWEFKESASNKWSPLYDNPCWVDTCEYRRKPKTIKVNGFDVPAPLQNAGPDMRIWVPSLTGCDFASGFRRAELGNSWFARGIVHATKEAAVAHAKAMLGIDPNEGE